MTQEQAVLLTAILTLTFGILMVAVGFYTFHYFTIGKKKKCIAETIGTVVGQAGTASQLYPVIEFEANGKIYRKRNSASVTKQKFGSIHVTNGYERGQQLPVYYDPDKPTRWMINDSKEQMVFPIVMLAGGFVFVAVAVIIFIFA